MPQRVWLKPTPANCVDLTAPGIQIVGEDTSLRITEIFHSLQGETSLVGLPTVFIRLTGCPLRCQYCDTTYSFHGGERLSLEDIEQTTQVFGARHVCVTGGEPLAQPGVHRLMTNLCDSGYVVSLETSGALDVSSVDPRVKKILDFKTPGSGEVHRNMWSNVAALTPHDKIKFVLCDRADYDWAVFKLDEHTLIERVGQVLFSPSYSQLPAQDLAQWSAKLR